MMKKLFAFMLLLLGAVQGIYAQEPYAVLSDDNTTLTFYYDNNKASRSGMSVRPFTREYNGTTSQYEVNSEWFSQRENITTVVFDKSFANYANLSSTACWFYECSNLTTINGIENLNTSNVTDMGYMFYGCSDLTSLDVSNFNTDNVINMSGMFGGCSSLTSFDLRNFNTANVTDMGSMFWFCSGLTTIYCNDSWSCSSSNDMFNGCTSLVGAISYDETKTDVTYANPTTGYFTATNPSVDPSVGGSKVLFRQDFETADTPADAGWFSPNLFGGMSLVNAGDNRIFEFNLGNNNCRNAYMTWNWDEGTIFEGLDVSEYMVKFQWGFTQNAKSMGSPKNVIYNNEVTLLSGSWDRYVSGHFVNNDLYAPIESLRLFSITQLKGAYSEDNPYWTSSTDNINYINDFYIDGNQENVIQLEEGTWYDISVTVNVASRTTKYSIYTKAGSLVKAGEGKIPADCNPFAKGINVLLGRYQSVADIDNVKVQIPTPGDYANRPQVSLTKIDMGKRTYRIFFEEGETLHVKGTDGVETTATISPYEYVTETSGVLDTWTVCGTATSEHSTIDVYASVIELPAAQVDLIKIGSGYAKTYSLSVENYNVPTKPTITLTYKYNGVGDENNELSDGTSISVIEKGVLEVTTHADGFRSSTVTINNDLEYVLDKVVDFQHMDEVTLLGMGFEEKEPLNSSNMSGENNWTARGRLWYGIADGGTDNDGAPTYEQHVVYGSSQTFDGAEPICRFFLKPSKLTEDVAKSIFAPVQTWYTGGEGWSTVADGSDVPGLKMYEGIGLVNSGLRGDNGFEGSRVDYTHGRISVNGLTDNDYYMVYTIGNYGGSSVHPLFPEGTAVEDATAQYKAMNMGDALNPLNIIPNMNSVSLLQGTEYYSLYRIDTAIARIEVFKPKKDEPDLNDGDTFTANTAEGVEMTFKVISATDKTCQVGDGTSEKTAVLSSTTGGVTIPAEVNGYQVVAIGDYAFSSLHNLTAVSVPNSVTTIGKKAFYGCSGLSTFIIPDGVSAIENYAFNGCSGLISITLPDNLMTIGVQAFGQCGGLTSITIPQSVTSIGGSAFAGCSGLTSVTIPNCVTSIGDFAFSHCSNLTSIEIPASVTSIGDFAFQLCTELTSVTIPSNVTSIGMFTFSQCGSLPSIEIPSSVTSIGLCAFMNCSSLTSLTIPNSVTNIENYAFSGCSGLNSISVENSNSNYDSRYNCNAIIETASNTLIVGCKNTKIPNTVTSIGYGAFNDCSGLTAITIPNSVTSIGASAFLGCSSLTSIEIPKSVTNIEDNAFKFCSGLISVTIPNSVTNIGNQAFADCNALKSIVSEIKMPFEINDDLFYSSNSNIYTTATLTVPFGTKSAYQSTAGWKNFVNIEEMALIPMDDEEVNFGKDGNLNQDTDLSGAVIDNVFFNIAPANGGYDAEEKCVVVSKPMTDEQIETVFGKDLLSDEVKSTFAGMVIEVPTGKGKITVEAQTTGGMTLKVKIGSADPVEMELEGKLKMKFPYNVEEPTYVYIYAGQASAASRSFYGSRGEIPSLRIYGISVSTETLLMGDANGDGKVTEADTEAVVSKILNKPLEKFNETAADINGDKTINMADVVGILNIILGNK